MRRVIQGVLAVVALALLPAVVCAQEGQIAGTVRDASGGVMPGVTVEASSPALIEKVRSTVTSSSGQYQLTNLPVGVYSVTFTLAGFSRQQRDNIELSSGFTASVNATMTVGQLTETVSVTASSPVVDVSNARQAITFQGADLRELPTPRNISSLLELTPGISSNYRPNPAFGQPGVCVGGIGTFCNPGVNGFNVGDTGAGFNSLSAFGDALGGTNMAQGRIMVDGQVINASTGGIAGMTGGYSADIAAAQEINIQVSGALGDSETGGASINIVPRTGGNRFAGDYNTTYTTAGWFDRNTSAYPTVPALFQAVRYDYDVSGDFGGPIKRDKLWFFAVARSQGIQKLPVGVDFWPNLYEGQAGFNYVPNRQEDRVEYKNIWRNASARITYQATQRNKFNIFWDEQDFCQDPCHGVVSVFTSPESWWSVQVHPNRLQQLSWTNPWTNRILLEAGISATPQHYNTTEHRQFTNPRGIPRITEIGDTAGLHLNPDTGTLTRVNQFAGGCATVFIPLNCGFALTSGSLNSALGGGAEVRDLSQYRTRASISYVSGRHHAKIGYDGGFFHQEQTNQVNDSRLSYYYVWPAANCADTGTCGNTSLQFPEDPTNLNRRPIPAYVQINTGSGTLKDQVRYSAFYAQDQWTLRRFTVSGALRYDHASSSYGETCLGPDPFVPQQSNGQRSYCVPESDGVSFHDITPRWGVTWDLFGNGRTSVKWNMGKYLTAAGISGIYSGANPARRTVNTLTRIWNDTDGDRVVDCDLNTFTPQGECGTFIPGSNDTTRFGRDPLSLDASGSPIGLQNTQCGRTEQGIPAAVQAYCAAYGDTLMSGWGKRQREWQLGIGIQHEILPRLSGEVTYNRRMYSNLVTTDTLNIGCDRFGRGDVKQCQEAMLRYSNPSYDFYSVVAPVDPRLPDGGGYRVLGQFTDRVTQPAGQPQAQTINPDLENYWQGVDTNFVWRGARGIRVNVGTSTGRPSRNTCFAMVDAPSVGGREGHEWEDGCATRVPFQTRMNGAVAYNIPWVDVLVSAVFQSLPGAEISASVTLPVSAITWMPESASRATEPCAPPNQALVGCVGAGRNQTTVNVPLLLNNEMFGERTTLWDLKLAKNIRFSNKRAVIGVDVYNLFNSDAIQTYNGTYTIDNPATPAVEVNNWLNPTGVVSPRFARLSVQFSF
jgi:hypothetical protein